MIRTPPHKQTDPAKKPGRVVDTAPPPAAKPLDSHAQFLADLYDLRHLPHEPKDPE